MNRLVKGIALRKTIGRFARLSSSVRHQSTTTAAAGKHDVAEEAINKYSPGQQLQDYTIVKVEHVAEYSLTALLLRHDNTGASHLHVARNDTNNVFGVAFRTTPLDDTGVPHILEHTVLCGSQKFPVRDPFFKMLNRSMATFMNAFTASDWTMYPFSSQNRQDYKNLMSVYLDAVFFPRLRDTDFRQEGWRLEHQDLNDPSSPIVFKGVVFNEMKGVFSNAQNWFQQKHQNLLLPDHTYSTVYGGDPAAIPDLTGQQLRDFHASHYHPSNARFYTYGDFPLEEHLQFLSENVLAKYSAHDAHTEVPPAKRWTEPRSAKISCSPDPLAADPNKQTTVAVSYLLSDITDLNESACLGILGTLLVGSEKSPFYQALIGANIGCDFSPVLGYEGNTKEATFSVGLQGIAEADVERVKQIIEETIDEVIERGFEQEQIDAVLHRVELSQKHQAAHFGLHLGVSILPTWTHEGNPIGAMNVTCMVNYFKQQLQDNSAFLQQKVKQYFKDNSHRLTLVMSPDPEFESRRKQEEEQKLQRMVASLTEKDREEVFVKGKELAALQDSEEDLSCLPSLKVEDVNRTQQTTETYTITETGDIPIQICHQPTNGVTYLRMICNMASVPEDLKPYVNLFCNVFTKMGTDSMNYMEQSQKIDLCTGGLSASPHVMSHPQQLNTFEQGVLLSSYCLDRNVPAMFSLWEDVFTKFSLSDSDRLTTLIRMCAADLANGVSDSGHAYAMGHAASSLCPAASVKETLTGLQQVAVMKKVAEDVDVEDVTAKLRQIGAIFLTADNIRCAMNVMPEESTLQERTLPAFRNFLSTLPRQHVQQPMQMYTQNPAYTASSCNSHVEMPFQVNFLSRSVQTVPYTHTDFASLRILARLMSAKFLHKEIREKGGAYGGGAAAGTSGLFNFYTYRDPNSMASVKAFDAGVEWAQAASFTQTDLDEAKLSTFSQVDAPVPPGQQGMTLFLHDITDQQRQEHRDQLFSASQESIVDVANRYLSPAQRVSSITLLGPQNNSIAEDKETWKVTQVM